MATPHTYQPVASDDENDDASSHHPKPEATNKWYQKPSVFWLLPIFLLFNLAMGATSMPRMNVIVSLICRNVLAKDSLPNFSDSAMPLSRRHGGMPRSSSSMSMNSTASSPAIIIRDYNLQCAIPAVESSTALFNLWGNLLAGTIAAIATPIWGKLSDRFGRVKPLAAASSVMFASEVVVVLVAKYPDAMSLGWVYLAFVLEGISGSFILIMALASSYAAYCTSLSTRTTALGYFHGNMFFGMAAGPALGGYLGMSSGASNLLLVFYTGLGMRASAILFLFLLVPESLSISPSTATLSLRPSSLPSLLQHLSPLRLLSILSPSSTPHAHTLLPLALINTILFGAVMAAMNESGVFLSTVNIFRTLATVGVLPLVVYVAGRWGGATRGYAHSHAPVKNNKEEEHWDEATTGYVPTLDVALLRTAIVSDMLGFIGYALAPTGTLFTLSGAIASLGAIGLATSMTKLLPAAQTGELLGALRFLQALARVVAPTVAGLVYNATAESVPQVVFWGIAGCFGVAGGLTFVVRRGGKGGGGVGGGVAGEA
ncbi:major facilitator superfamily domain-containing protein [Massariosphaeria phaeospora]|uniref:Major facilitator superfamily domain-containing protein n=1 Tax=Massariosphaeria phaeospora TaxID=100035 RepID=A0A7C8I660_9PLEO|nr:major facilitator superfamily domain-containing protein [Massariosphaeria phaeospora]